MGRLQCATIKVSTLPLLYGSTGVSWARVLTLITNERQIMTRLEKRIRAKFSRIEELRASGNHKEVKFMSDVWTKRISSNVKGFYDNKKARVPA